ncbi:MAG: fibronectin type III domain-containing protein [Eubacteriales bacterium]|nr:fibronectin type III domain-containing protein [Eubacteriales bacterium]
MFSKSSFVYNNKVQKPTVTVKDAKGNKIASSNYTVSYGKGCKNVGSYKITVKFKGKKYTGSLSKTFTIVPKATTLKSVTAAKKGFTAKWAKQAPQTTGYQIQYAANSKFTGAKTVTVSKNKTVSAKVSKLAAKKKYYVRVRTYKTVNGKKYYSAWSKSMLVTTKK